MKTKIYLAVMWLLSCLNVMAQNYTIKGSVDPVVHENENFNLRYVINTTDVQGFSLGKMPDEIDILIGPNESRSVSVVSMNGHSQREETLTLTYVLSATKTGKFTIPAATAKVGGQTLRSQPLTVQVISSRQQPDNNAQSSAKSASKADFFVVTTASKHHVTENEPLLLTYKVCWDPDLPVSNLDEIKLELQDVFMQPYNNTQRKSQKVETINGRVLVTIDWYQYVIYPQKAGKLQIPSQKFNGYVQHRVAIDPFDTFAGGTQEVPFALVTQPVDIQVDPLPQGKPAGFSGGVGRFSISASLDKNSVRENVPITLSVTVKGKGNINMLREPVAVFPKEFDTYDTKQTDDYQLTADGLDGTIRYDYVAVPQVKGKYIIEPVRFSYYDTSTRSYQTIQTDSFQIEVLKGDGSSGSVHDFSDGQEEQKGDIRPIRTGSEQTSKSHSFFASSSYVVIIIAILLLAVAAFFYLRHKTNYQMDVVSSRRKKANKIAVRRLRKAAQLMKAGTPAPFYDETLRALWGYVGDKLNIPVSELSRENISQKLADYGVGEETTASFIAAIDECEFVRYAPGDPQGNMKHVYDKSITAIEHIESVKKKSKGIGSVLPSTLMVAVLSLFGTMSTMPIFAQSKVQADEAYAKGEYDEAIAIYEKVAAANSSANVYYNLGNAYYRKGDIARAILSYERVLRLQPGDDDARFNLQLAQSKTTDKIAPEREMFFVTWFHSVVNFLSIDTWAYLALFCLAVGVLCLLTYFFADGERTRKMTFNAFILLLLLFIVSNIFASKQKSILNSHSDAIVVADVLPVKNIPSDNGTNSFTIHAGTKVKIVDDTMSQWKKIKLSDGREGWISLSSIEII